MEPVNPALACAEHLSSSPPFTESARRPLESWIPGRRRHDGLNRYTPAGEPEGTHAQRDATAMTPRRDDRRRLTRATRNVPRRMRFVRRSWLGIDPTLHDTVPAARAVPRATPPHEKSPRSGEPSGADMETTPIANCAFHVKPAAAGGPYWRELSREWTGHTRGCRSRQRPVSCGWRFRTNSGGADEAALPLLLIAYSARQPRRSQTPVKRSSVRRET